MQIERSDEFIYREAEKLINSRYSYYATKYPNQGSDMYMLMMALDVAVRLKRVETTVDATPLEKPLAALLAEVEEALNQK